MDDQPAGAPERDPASPAALGPLFLLFFWIGSTAFGGFMALITVVQDYAVERRRMLTHEEMLDGISLASVLPGPAAVNVVAYVGYRAAGGTGALVSTAAVILPSFLLILGLSYTYFQFGRIPAVEKAFRGFIPAVAAIILAAAGNMGKRAIKGFPEMLIALSAAGLLAGVGGLPVTIGVIAASAVAGWALFRERPNGQRTNGAEAVPDRLERTIAAERRARHPVFAASALSTALLLIFNAPAIVHLSLTFGGMSMLLFGGGYVFIPMIQQIVVDDYGWVTTQEFIDAIALGQVTPGPVLISAAFIGYKVAGLAGAAAATIAIFAPPAAGMAFCTRTLDRIRRLSALTAALRGVRPAVVGMVCAAGVSVARTAPANGTSLMIFALALFALLRFRIGTALIVPAAGIAGLLLY